MKAIAATILTSCLLLVFHAAFSSENHSEIKQGPVCYMINGIISFTVISNRDSGNPADPDEITIPLKRAGRLLLMEAKIDNETGNFIFDTGSSKLVLNNTYFRKYVSIESGEKGGITGSVSGVRQTKVSRIQISGLSYTNTMADLVDLGHIENRRGVKILGLFGFSLLKNMEIVIDVCHNELHIYRLNKSGNRLSSGSQEFKADISQKVQMYQDVLFVSSQINGKILSFCLDTGAESNVISSASPKKVMSTVSITRRSGLVGSGKPSAEALYGTLNDFVMSGHQIPMMQTIITNLDDMSASFGFTIDGMLGYDFFEKGQVCINLVRMEMKINFNKNQGN
jgi:predicted aspartyl protease